MANRTIKEANSIKGTNPQYLIEKIIRNRIYDSRFWKEECFGLTAELLVDKAMALDHIGGSYGQNILVTPFLCLVLKMLQIQPSKDIVVEFIRRSDYKYVRALGAYYLRLVGTSVDVYKYLEPLYIDYRKMKYKTAEGGYALTHMDEYIDELLNEDRVFGILLPRLQKRWVLEECELLPPRVSALDDDLAGGGEDLPGSEPESDSSSSQESPPRSSVRRHRSVSPDDNYRRRDSSPYRDSNRHSHRHRRDHSPYSSRHPHRRRSRSASRSPRRRDRRDQDRDRDRSRRDREEVTRDRGKDKVREEVSGKYSKEELEDIRQQNEVRASLGLKPLKL